MKKVWFVISVSVLLVLFIFVIVYFYSIYQERKSEEIYVQFFNCLADSPIENGSINTEDCSQRYLSFLPKKYVNSPPPEATIVFNRCNSIWYETRNSTLVRACFGDS